MMPFLLKYPLAVLLLSACLSANASSEKWEYLTKTINLLSDSVITQQLNKLGAKNWELVSCSESKAKLVCIFKRRV
jgi:hypothetical protein